MLLQPKHIKPDEKWNTTLSRGRGVCRLLKFKGLVASVPTLLKLIESLSEVVGTHVCSACKWIVTVFYTHYLSPPPPQSMLLQPKHIKPDEKCDTTLSRGRGVCRLLKFKGFVASVPTLLKLIVS
jgi:hypothetical protein